MIPPIQLYPESTPAWYRDPIRPVPTLSDLSAAAQASYDAFEAYDKAYKNNEDVTELWAAYMAAIERSASISNKRFVAKLEAE